MADRPWQPFPGPQTAALSTEADELFYGGQAGGGKTDLLIGAAHTLHWRSVIFRREYPQLKEIKSRCEQLFAKLARFSGKNEMYKFLDGRRLEFGACANVKDLNRWQGRPHDLIGFDEICHFTEPMYLFLSGWKRTSRRAQRARIICAGNPPLDATGDWVIDYWGPWLDEHHAHPALPGELRWYARIEGKSIEQEDGTPFWHKGEFITPLSRTFIPASVDDNPVLIATGYKAQLQALPEPLRSMLLKGSFGVAQEDHPWQIIPTAWVRAAQQRWVSRPEPTTPMTQIGVDVARGGKDRTVLTPRFDNWFGLQKAFPGMMTPDGQAVVQMIVNVKGSENPDVAIDVIGIGAAAYDVGKGLMRMTPLNGSEKTEARDRSGQLKFRNQRAQWMWQLREALDPDKGDDLAIPPDREILADLCAPRWTLSAQGIQVELKDEIKERIGRSPDKGESLVYAHAQRYMPGLGIYRWYEQKAMEKAAAEKAAAEAAANVGA